VAEDGEEREEEEDGDRTGAVVVLRVRGLLSSAEAVGADRPLSGEGAPAESEADEEPRTAGWRAVMVGEETVEAIVAALRWRDGENSNKTLTPGKYMNSRWMRPCDESCRRAVCRPSTNQRTGEGGRTGWRRRSGEGIV
jgi:hypothetical protein